MEKIHGNLIKKFVSAKKKKKKRKEKKEQEILWLIVTFILYGVNPPSLVMKTEVLGQ